MEEQWLRDLVARARLRAATWRVAGAGEALDVPLRPPASSALLAANLAAIRHLPVHVPSSQRAISRRLREAVWDLTPELRARVERLERYSDVATAELAGTIARLDTELAELRARVQELEDERRR